MWQMLSWSYPAHCGSLLLFQILPSLLFHTDLQARYFWLVLSVTLPLSEKKIPKHQKFKLQVLCNIHIIFFWAGEKKILSTQLIKGIHQYHCKFIYVLHKIARDELAFLFYFFQRKYFHGEKKLYISTEK